MRNNHPVRLACAALAGLTLAAVGLAGSASAAGPAGSAPAANRGGIISTIAGGPGGPGPATSYSLSPCDVHYARGSVYIGDGGLVRAVNVATDVLTTVAGNGANGPTSSGGPATGTAIGGTSFAEETDSVGNACGAAVDAAGNLVIVRPSGVWVVAAKTGTFYGQRMTAGHIYQVPGGGADVAVDRYGNLVLAATGWGFCGDGGSYCDYSGAAVNVLADRTGTFYGQKMTAGHVYTVAGVANPGPVGDGGPATQAWLGTVLGTVQLDRYGNIVVADGGGCCNGAPYPDAPWIIDTVRVIADGTGTFYGQKMIAGDIYTVAGDGNGGSSGNGGPAPKAELSVQGAAIDHAGNLVIADSSQVRVVAAKTGVFYGQKMTVGDIYHLAGVPGYAGFFGDGGPAARAKVNAVSVTIDGAGNVVFADSDSRVRVIAEKSGTFYGRRMKARYIYTVAGNGSAQGLSGLGGPALSAQIGSPNSISADSAGDVAASSSGTALVLPARTGTFYGRHMTAGHVYMLAEDGCPADNCVALDGNGNLVMAGSPVRLIAIRSGRFFGRPMTAGHSYAISASATAVEVDRHGNALLLDGNRIKVIAAGTGTFYGKTMYAGETYTVAGTGWPKFNGDGELATKANIEPQDVVADAAGNLIVTDWISRIRVVAARTGTIYGQKMTAGHIYTIAGYGIFGFSGNGGPATAADVGHPDGVTVAPSGTVLFADPVNGVVWAVPGKTGTFYGQKMTAGHIYVVAGGGTRAPDDGGPATSTILSPASIAISPVGDLLLTDGIRLRAISP